MDWQSFFSSYRKIPITSEADLLYQVGYTVGGVAIRREQFEAILADIEDGLSFDTGDNVLDLCCGNGLLAYEIGRKVRTVWGIDFCDEYIRNAKAFRSRDNIQYFCLDVIKASDVLRERGREWTKILMYSSLAYFSVEQFERLLDMLLPYVKPGARMFIGSIPDARQKGRFYDTWPRRATYLWNVKCLGRESGIGNWWARENIATACRRRSMSCEFRQERSAVHTARYRFDVVMVFGGCKARGGE